MKKAQVAYEFMMVLLVLSLGFVVWVAFASSFQEDLQQTKNLENAQDFSLSIKHELFVVVQMHEGFSRVFDLPLTIAGQTYLIQTYNYPDLNFSTIYLNATEIGFYTNFDVPLMNDTIKKGKNILTKKQGVIEVKNVN